MALNALLHPDGTAVRLIVFVVFVDPTIVNNNHPRWANSWMNSWATNFYWFSEGIELSIHNNINLLFETIKGFLSNNWHRFFLHRSQSLIRGGSWRWMQGNLDLILISKPYYTIRQNYCHYCHYLNKGIIAKRCNLVLLSPQQLYLFVCCYSKENTFGSRCFTFR